MGTSAAQINANRANAQFSTGPRTDAGKQASAANAITSGLTSAKIFYRPEEESEFLTLTGKLFAELQPEGTAQTLHFDTILHATWNLRRCLTLEAEIQNEAVSKGLSDALLDDDLSRKLDRIYRYKKMHESSHRRAIAELRTLQTEQLRRRETPELEGASILVDTGKLPRPRHNKTLTDQAFRAQIEQFIAPPTRHHDRL